MGLSPKAVLFLEAYLQTWNASEAARRAGYSAKTAGSIGHDLLKKPEIKEAIRRRVADSTVGANEGLTLLTAQARASATNYFKVAERWTESPRLTDETVEETQGQDDKGNPVRLYRVRYLALDINKLLDPQLGAVIHRLKDSPKDGLSFELYDAQTAVVKLLEAQGVFRAGATANVNLDLQTLSDAQLERIYAGEDPVKVLIDGQRNGGAAR